jgi:hypothetical protein
MMEAARTCETLVNFYQTTQRYNPEDIHLLPLIICQFQWIIISSGNWFRHIIIIIIIIIISCIERDPFEKLIVAQLSAFMEAESSLSCSQESARQIRTISSHCCFQMKFNPLKLSGNYMYHLLQQSVTLHFVFMGFV